MGRIGRVCWALFIIAVPLFLITGSVTWAFNSPGLYNNGFEKYSVSRVSGITDSDLRQVGADIRSYINSGRRAATRPHQDSWDRTRPFQRTGSGPHERR